MSHEQEDHENDAFLWENQSWVNLSNDTSDNSGGEKAVSLPEVREEKEKKRGRGASKKGKGEKGEKKEGEETPDHEIHIWTERERRKKMRNMFSNLHSLLPQLPPKVITYKHCSKTKQINWYRVVVYIVVLFRMLLNRSIFHVLRPLLCSIGRTPWSSSL